MNTEIFKNRPLALFCAIFMSASALGFFVRGEAKIVLIALCAAVLISVILILIAKRRIFAALRTAMLCALAIAVGMASSYIYFDIGYMSMRKYDGSECDIRAVVTDPEYYSDSGTAYTVRLISVNGEPCDKLAYLCCEYGGGLQTGYLFDINARVDEPSDDSFGYSKKSNLISDGITVIISSDSEDDITVVSKDHMTPEIFFKKLNSELSVRLSRAVGGEAGDLASAMFLADRSGLDAKTRLDFSRVGTSHLLALSGLHMAIVAAIAEAFLERLCIKKTVRCIILSALLGTYLALVGFALSAVRAVIMIYAVFLSYIVRASGDPKTALFFAGFAILAFSPSAVCDIGFWMSFFATLGIIVISPIMSRMFRGKENGGKLSFAVFRALRYIISAVAVTVVANFSVLFFMWRFFGQVSLIAPLTNLLLSPLSSALIMFSALTLIFYFPLPAVSSAFAACASFFAEIILRASSALSDMRGIVLSLKYDFAGFIVCAFSVAAIIVLVIRLKRKCIALVPAAATVLLFCICLGIHSIGASKATDVSYIRQKNGELLVLSECSKAVVCDMSDGYYSRLRLGGMLAAEHCATEIEVLLLTHYHSRQPQAVNSFLENFKTRAVWLPEPKSDYEYSAMQGITQKADALGVPTVIYRHGSDMRLFGDTELTVFPYRKLERSVEAQVGLSLLRGDSRLTYLGSSYSEGDIPDDIRSTVSDSEHLIFGCHGPKAKEGFSVSTDERSVSVIIADSEAFLNGLISLSPDSLEKVTLCPEYKRYRLS